MRNCSLGENGGTASDEGKRGEEGVGREGKEMVPVYAEYVPGISRNIRAARILDVPTNV